MKGSERVGEKRRLNLRFIVKVNIGIKKKSGCTKKEGKDVEGLIEKNKIINKNEIGVEKRIELFSLKQKNRKRRKGRLRWSKNLNKEIKERKRKEKIRKGVGLS